jgi:hypothetical protein
MARIGRAELISELRKGKVISFYQEDAIAQEQRSPRYFLERKPDYPDVHATTVKSLLANGIIKDCVGWLELSKDQPNDQ